MPVFAPATAEPLLWVIALASSQGTAGDQSVQFSQVTIEQRVIIRVPIVPPRNAPVPSAVQRERGPPPPRPPAVEYKEVKGPKCLQMRNLRGAIVEGERTLMLFSAPGERYRAHFGKSCRGADFYAGFYIVPNKDGSLCAGRDDLHTRNGSTCEVQRFSRLVPDE